MGTEGDSEPADSMWNPWDPLREPAIAAAVEEAVLRAQANGVSESDTVDQILEAVTEAMPAVIDEAGATLASALQRRAPRMLAEHRRLRRGFERRLSWIWGDALDLLYQVWVCCEEIGRDFNHAHRPAAGAEQDHRFEALVSVHARACATSSEVHALLRTGHALGAWARWRTLHELSVVASILGAGDDDLANRFLVHAAAEAYQDALLHERHRERTRRDPYPVAELEELRRVHDQALATYGNGFAQAWRWADPVTAPERATFRRLEKIAGLDHLRPDFRLASHVVHAGSRGTDFLRAPFRGGSRLLTGPSNAGLAEPGHGAAISLIQVTIQLVLKGRTFDYNPIVTASLQALLRLSDQSGEAFRQADQDLRDLEGRFLRAQRRGRAATAAYESRTRLRRLRKWMIQSVRRWSAR